MSISILIVDDTPSRHNRLLERLKLAGVARENVDICQNKHDALAKLELTHYQLLIIDILIPNRPEERPKKENSLDLLYQLQEDDDLVKPDRVIGITADSATLADVSDQFAAWTWTILSYADDNDEWIESIENCVRYIQKKAQSASAGTRISEVDLAIVCALDTPELASVLRLPWDWKPPRPINESVFVYDGRIELNGRTLSVVAACPPRMGMVATSLLASSIIHQLRPKLLAMTGICGGLPDKVRMGEVILCDPVWDYQSGKRVLDESGAVKLQPAMHQISVDQRVRASLETLKRDLPALDELGRSYSAEPPGQLRLKVGPVACGSAVIADGETVATIRSQQRDTLAVEMEAYGLYAACCMADGPRPLTFALKAVCDFADPSKNDAVQDYAAFASAAVLRLLMERHGPSLVDAK